MQDLNQILIYLQIDNSSLSQNNKTSEKEQIKMVYLGLHFDVEFSSQTQGILMVFRLHLSNFSTAAGQPMNVQQEKKTTKDIKSFVQTW